MRLSILSAAALVFLPGAAAAAEGDPTPAAAPCDPTACDEAVLKRLEAEVESLKAAHDELRANLEMQTMLAEEASQTDEPTLRIYGFADAGYTANLFVADDPNRGILENPGSFTVGNLNLYFDAHPGAGWRFLTEVRLSLYPHGNLAVNGLDLDRTDTTVYDTTSPAGRNKVSWSGIVLERAHIDYSTSDAVTLRVGMFLTPYGIWNVDHGTPTLISLLLPAFQIDDAIPQRQVGIQLLGSLDFAPWQLGYAFYVSNGRTKALRDFTADKAFGGRVFARSSGDLRLTLGASGYWGTFNDLATSITLEDGFKIENEVTMAGTEMAAGVDVSLDVEALRVRTEALVRSVEYDPGKHEPGASPGTYKPNGISVAGYLLVAYRLPWLGLEPYAVFDYKWTEHSAYDIVMQPGVGLNIYFTPYAQLKTQYSGVLFDSTQEGGLDQSMRNFASFSTRLVIAF